MTIEEMSARMSNEQTALAKKVRAKMKEVKCFECEGVLFKGSAFIAAMEFAYNNPNGGDFYAWLQDSFEIVKA